MQNNDIIEVEPVEPTEEPRKLTINEIFNSDDYLLGPLRRGRPKKTDAS